LNKFIFAFLLIVSAPFLYAAPSQTVWFVAGAGVAANGDDENPGTSEQPLASVQRALNLIKVAYASEPFESAIIVIEGTVTNYGNEMEIFGMVTIRGEGAYPAVILRGSGAGDILNAGGRERVLFIDDGNNVIIENLTLSGGRASIGAGVYAANSRLVVGDGSVIIDNEGGFGGGICVEDGTLLMRGSITANRAENGGGLALRGKTVLEISGTVTDNYAFGSGGGILLDGGTGEIKSGTISGNTAESGSGGGIYLQGKGAVLEIHGGEISGNNAPNGDGGGIFVYAEAHLSVLERGRSYKTTGRNQAGAGYI